MTSAGLMIRTPALLLLAAAVAACAPADRLLTSPRPAPTTEDYAVWGAALDREVPAHYADIPVLLVRRRAGWGVPAEHIMRNIRRQQPRYGIEEGMITAFFSPDSAPVRLDPEALRRHTRLRIDGALEPAPLLPDRPLRPDGHAVPIISVSRVAYDRTRRWALVWVHWSCGGRCGNGAISLMLKDGGGAWRKIDTLVTVYS